MTLVYKEYKVKKKKKKKNGTKAVAAAKKIRMKFLLG